MHTSSSQEKKKKTFKMVIVSVATLVSQAMEVKVWEWTEIASH